MVRNGHIEDVDTILASGSSVHEVNTLSGTMPLIVASQESNVAMASKLIEVGAAVNQAATDGRTPLYFACLNGHSRMTSVLLAAGAAVNKPARKGGATPLLVASMHGHVDVVSRLLVAGAGGWLLGVLSAAHRRSARLRR